jgi:nucleotide-binding universal stress UspA family protein
MSQIVVGYDGSDRGRVALDRGLELARDLGDGVVIVFGYAPPGIWGGEIADHEEAIEEFGEKVMGEARDRAKASGLPCDVALVPKRPVDALLEIADERDARMIVVGTQGETPIKEAILGSTPHKLLHASQRPVLVVPTHGER